MKRWLLIAVLLASVTLGFAQEDQPGESEAGPVAVEATATATAVSTAPTAPAPAPATTLPPTPQFVEVEAEVTTRGRTTGLYRSPRELTPEEKKFLEGVPERDGNGNRLRDGYEAGFRTSDDFRTATLHPPFVTDTSGNRRYLSYQEARALNMTSSKEVWQVLQAAEARQNVSTTGTARFKVPVIPGPPGTPGAPGAPGCPGPAGETVYVQPAPQPCAPTPEPVPSAYCPPPPPPRPVVYLQVGQWAAPPTTALCAPGTITTYGQPAFPGGSGFTYVQGQRLTLSNNSASSSSATGGNATGGNATGGNGYGYGGAGGAGGSAWQNQGQTQGQMTLVDIQNTLNNINQWINSNTNNNHNQAAANAAAQTNTGIAIDN